MTKAQSDLGIGIYLEIRSIKSIRNCAAEAQSPQFSTVPCGGLGVNGETVSVSQLVSFDGFVVV
jgi:hypothetical protein